MHLNSRPLLKRWSIVQIPILPFLAPRVFTPWLYRDRRAHSSAQGCPTRKSGAADHEIPQLSKDKDYSRRALKAEEPPAPTDLTNRQGESTPQGHLQTASSASRNTQATNSEFDVAELSSEEKFKRKYEEIWGAIHERTLPGPTAPVLERNSDEGVYASGNETAVDKESFAIFNSVSRASSALEDRPNTNLPEPGHSSEILVRRMGSRNLDSENSGNSGNAPNKSSQRRRRLALQYDRRQVQNFKLPKRPEKWVSWTPSDRSNILEWQRRFAVVDARHQNYNGRVKFTNSTGHNFSEESKKALIEESSFITLHAEWDLMQESQQQKLWPELICTALDKYPNSALKVLSATYTPPYPPSYAVADCLQFIIFHYLGKNKFAGQQDIQRLFGVLNYLLRNTPSHKLHLNQDSVHLLVTNIEPSQVKALYELLDDINNPLRQNTLMHFTYQLSKYGDIDQAFSILQRIGHEGGDFNSPQMASLCANLLEKNGCISNTSISDSQIFQFMLGCGMKPNLIIYNILLQNSFKRGDHETGWQIYDMMAENGIKADKFTYSILLNDSKLRRDDYAINHVVQMIRESGLKNAHLGTDLLHAIFLLTEKGNLSRSSDEYQNMPGPFEKMLSVYCEYFEPQALAQIIPFFQARFGHLISQDATQSQVLLVPPPPTLHIMLTGLLTDITTQDLKSLYNCFRLLVSTSDPVISGAMQSTQVYNSFLMAFGKSMDTLDWCPRIIGDMVSSAKAVSSGGGSETDMNSEEDAAPTKTKRAREGRTSQTIQDAINPGHPNAPHDGPAPDVYTWSILLHIFISHGQARAAEKVLTMMESRGVTPNQVTWNSLIAGYARMQDISMTVDAVDRLEKAGFQPDDFTMRGIAGIRDNRALIEAMKAKEEANFQMSFEDRNRSQKIEDSLDKAFIDDEHLHTTNEGGGNAGLVVDDDINRDLEVKGPPIPIHKYFS